MTHHILKCALLLFAFFFAACAIINSKKHNEPIKLLWLCPLQDREGVHVEFDNPPKTATIDRHKAKVKGNSAILEMMLLPEPARSNQAINIVCGIG